MKTETDRVCGRTCEWFYLVKPGMVGQRGTEAVSSWLLDGGEFESTGGLEAHACG